MKFLLVFLLLSCSLISACSSELTDEERYALDGKPLLKGNVLVRPVGHLKFSNEPSPKYAVTREELTLAVSKLREQPVRMGATLLHNGVQYVTIEDFAVDGPSQDTPPHDNAKSFDRTDGLGLSQSPLATGIIGADNRYPVPDSSVWPWSTSVLVKLSNAVAGCSGSLIGPHTVVTAAHCFYQNGVWRSTTFFAPGADDDTSPTYPFGTYWSWAIWMPNQWYNSNGTDGAYDFAVVDLSGAGLNGQASWLGTIVLSMVYATDLPILRSGYDGDKQSNEVFSPFNLIPEQWASNGSVYSASAPNYGIVSNYVYTNADVKAGASGSGIYLNSGADAGRLVAILTSGFDDWFPFLGGPLNIGTHWLSWTYNFTHAVDTHWP